MGERNVQWLEDSDRRDCLLPKEKSRAIVLSIVARKWRCVIGPELPELAEARYDL